MNVSVVAIVVDNNLDFFAVVIVVVASAGCLPFFINIIVFIVIKHIFCLMLMLPMLILL